MRPAVINRDYLLKLAERLRAGEPISTEDRELLSGLLERKVEKDYPAWPVLPDGIRMIERTYSVFRDGTRELGETKYYPANPLPDVVYDDDGIPDAIATARQRDQFMLQLDRLELEQKRKKERSRAQRNARVNRDKKGARDQAIAAFAFAAVRKSDELACSPKKLVNYVLDNWDNEEWGSSLARSTLRRKLAEQHVFSRLRKL